MEGDLRSVLREAARIAGDGESGAVAWMVNVRGSGPQVVGARLALRQDGRFVGTVGGGAIEAAVIADATAARLDPNRGAKLHTYQLTAELGMCCGGTMEVLIEPIHGRDRTSWEALQRAEQEGGSFAMVIDGEDPRFVAGGKVVVGPGALPSVHTHPSPFGSAALQEALLDVLEAARRQGMPSAAPPTPETREVPADGVTARLYVEAFEPTPRLVLFGAGHVAQPVARLSKMLGYHVMVVDDREAWANRERFPDADELVLEPYVDFLFHFDARPSDTLVIVTRGHEFDQELLAALIDKPRRYLGMIGSRAKVKRAFLRLEAAGVSRDQIARVRAPIGLNLGAQTPEEIAVAVAAELVAERHGKPRPPGFGWWREEG